VKRLRRSKSRQHHADLVGHGFPCSVRWQSAPHRPACGRMGSTPFSRMTSDVLAVATGHNRLDGFVEPIEMRIDLLQATQHVQRPFVLIEILKNES